MGARAGGGVRGIAAGGERGEPSLFSYYGATNPAEFFAVASEVFFEQAELMAAAHPELYGELARFYQVESAELVERPGGAVPPRPASGLAAPGVKCAHRRGG